MSDCIGYVLVGTGKNAAARDPVAPIHLSLRVRGTDAAEGANRLVHPQFTALEGA